MRALSSDFGRYSIASVVAALIAGLGLIALLGVTLRM
jgi:putative membrane protein